MEQRTIMFAIFLSHLIWQKLSKSSLTHYTQGSLMQANAVIFFCSDFECIISCLRSFVFSRSFKYCSCMFGFQSGAAPPNCVPFPKLVQVHNVSNGIVTDGKSAGRMREGADTMWSVQPNGSVRSLSIRIRFWNPVRLISDQNSSAVSALGNDFSFTAILYKGTSLLPYCLDDHKLVSHRICMYLFFRRRFCIGVKPNSVFRQ